MHKQLVLILINKALTSLSRDVTSSLKSSAAFLAD